MFHKQMQKTNRRKHVSCGAPNKICWVAELSFSLTHVTDIK